MSLPLSKLQGLLVVNLPATIRNPAPNWEGKRRFFAPESCARQILVGSVESKTSLPQIVLNKAQTSISSGQRVNHTKSTLVKEGPDAYQYLLELACGLHSHRKGESPILGQVKTAWNAFCQSVPDRAKELSSVIQAIFDDANKIRHSVLERLRVIGYEMSAAALAHIQGQERVLIVGGKSNITLNTARALGRECKRMVSSISITHINDSELIERYQELQEAKHDKTLKSEVRSVTKTQVFEDGLDPYDHAFVCDQMGSDIDSSLVTAWERRKRANGYLVHLKGSSENMGQSTDFWRTVQLQNLILPEAVRQQYVNDIAGNNRTLEAAVEACALCSSERASGGVLREFKLVEALQRKGYLTN